ncbi:MAG: hypothetical protein KA954_11455 [Chitinophagales bacterium]|nr:hypothetical protein [Chitinophagales bacterium]MBP9704639.1 hypothetical protein [Chitinophagales bacterium]
MAIATITKWLTSARDFDAGILLYKRWGESTFFKSVLDNGYSTEVYNRLQKELQGLEHQKNDEEEIQAPVIIGELPEDLKNLQLQINDAYGRMRLLHATLESLPTKARRAECAADIKETFQWIDECYDQINYWKATGKRKPGNVVEKRNEITLRDMVHTYMNLRPNICKTKNKLKRERDAQRMTMLSGKIQAWEDELLFYDKIIEEKGDVVIYDRK